MNRTAATNVLTERFRELATYAKFTNDQITAAYNAGIDNSLRYLGVQETDLPTAVVAQADTLKYLALLDYFALERFENLLSIQFDVELPGPLKATRKQAFENVGLLMGRAENKLASLGIVIGANNSGFQLGRVELDFLEPSIKGDFGRFFFW